MARRVEYMLSQAYNLGYDDGYKDSKEEVSQDPILQSSIKASMEMAVDVAKKAVIDKACEILRYMFKFKWTNHENEYFRKAMEEGVWNNK